MALQTAGKFSTLFGKGDLDAGADLGGGDPASAKAPLLFVKILPRRNLRKRLIPFRKLSAGVCRLFR